MCLGEKKEEGGVQKVLLVSKQHIDAVLKFLKTVSQADFLSTDHCK